MVNPAYAISYAPHAFRNRGARLDVNPVCLGSGGTKRGVMEHTLGPCPLVLLQDGLEKMLGNIPSTIMPGGMPYILYCSYLWPRMLAPDASLRPAAHIL